MVCFPVDEYEDAHFTDGDFWFLNPSHQFQSNLDNILQLCNWDTRDLIHIFGISKSTCNNILGNASMTNSKPTLIRKVDLITLLMCIQNKKIKENNSLLLVFYLFAILCPGSHAPLNFEPYKNLLALEKSLPPKLLLQNLVCLSSDNTIRDFNRFIEWRMNKPNVSITEYYGQPEKYVYSDLKFDKNEPLEKEITKAIKYKNKFIPLYLDWYVSKITEWCR